MHRITDSPTGLRQTLHDAIEIRLWEVYILRNRNNLLDLLTSYSLDKGPVSNNQQEGDRIIYRFMFHDWRRTIQPFLNSYSIPFEVVKNLKVDISEPIAKKKIYVAEDDLNTLFALGEVLEGAGYDVVMAHCGMPMMEESLPETDVFILDTRMPDVDGLSICRHLRSRKRTQHTPVIMISAWHDAASEAIKAGANDFLEKPFRTHELLHLLSKYTDPRLVNRKDSE